MIGVSENISELKYRYEDDRYYRIMTLFTYFEIDKDEQSLRVAVSEQFEYVLNQLELNFTYYKLDDFVDIKSTYAKTAYRLFKQWKTVGKVRYEIDGLKARFDTPKNYGISNIDSRVINPIMSELPAYFKNLKVEKIKSNSRGTPVTGYEFTWKPETTGKWVDFNESNKQLDDDFEPVPMINWLKDFEDLGIRKKQTEDLIFLCNISLTNELKVKPKQKTLTSFTEVSDKYKTSPPLLKSDGG